ncbi:hypothetical protein HK414_05595 [Ramlibacter terrae]|uniref:Uncharacterized protein n=1 Tax=Ramlibacter terrae TaxID=2732511 RepID=A0ABX6NZD5_9BURK|nr:hypothetical protein HK414_05595 [Ramlibacter terrae]
MVDAAEPSLFPYKPNLLRNVLVGLLAGLLLGAAIVAVLEVMDDSIKYPDEVERLLGLPLLGIIPKLKGKRRIVAMEVHEDPSPRSRKRTGRSARRCSSPPPTVRRSAS